MLSGGFALTLGAQQLINSLFFVLYGFGLTNSTEFTQARFAIGRSLPLDSKRSTSTKESTQALLARATISKLH